MKFRSSLLLLLVVLLALFSFPTFAQDPLPLPSDSRGAGLIFKVNTRLDTIDVVPGDTHCADANGKCSLRAAVMESNRQPYPSTIDLPAGVYTLTLAGEGTFYGDDAGDLDIHMPITLIGGGAQRTTIDANNLDRVFEVYAATFEIYAVEIKSGNTADVGGALMIYQGNILLDGVYLHDNFANDDGGGIYVYADANLTIKNSTFYMNETNGDGGGIYFGGGTLSVETSTISTNAALDGGGGVYQVGDSTSQIYRSTIAYNSAANGGGVFTSDSTGISGSLIAHNLLAGGQGADCYGAFSGQDNLISDTGFCTVPVDTIVTANQSGIMQVLELDSRFGTMPVHLVSATGLGVDASLFCLIGMRDQIGAVRTAGDNVCDIGAVEYFEYPDLVVNGSFEQPSAANSKLPDGWTASGVTTDKLVCNTANKLPAARGNCAMQLTGAAGKNVQLKQNLDASAILSGVDVLLYAQISAKKVAYNGAKITVKLTYNDDTKQTITLSIPAGTYDYQALYAGTALTSGLTVTKAKLTVAYKGASGSVTVDDVKFIPTE